MRVTINDVAKHAGISVRTVSRVLNDHPNVSDFTRARVLEAMKELDFGPNALARGLARQESYTIGVLIPDVANPYFAEVVRGIEDVSAQASTTYSSAILMNTPSRKAARFDCYARGR